MNLETHHQSPPEHSPVPSYIFPDDELVADTDYKQAMESGYVSSLSTLSGAAESFGLHCDGETIERWRRVGACAGLLDDFLDESSDKELAYALYSQGILRDVPVTHEMPEWVDRRLPAALQLLENSTRVLPTDQVRRMKQSALAIGELSRAKTLCSDTAVYIDLLRTEAWHTAVLVHESTSADMRNLPGFDAFAAWVHRALELGTLYDSSRDIKDDANAERTGVKPSALNCMRIALSARSPLYSLLADKKNRRAARASLWSRLRHINL